MSEETYTYLNEIDSPEDLRRLNHSELKAVCSEVREFIID
ncbi:MAG: hypothetical protein HYZ33_03135, partial [Ignavibacteriales bacterium]|nr:hypothetical protein [Ignavibacteriales bacterium]